MTLRPLPPEAQRLCHELRVPERLRRHLNLVFDVACELVEQLAKAFPTLVLDEGSITLGSGLHDIGKVLHVGEITGPDRPHETDGPRLLEQHGIAPGVANYARTHGTWKDEAVGLGDLLVGLADNLAMGRRNEELENTVVEAISMAVEREPWLVFQQVADMCESVAVDGDRRLFWQLLA